MPAQNALTPRYAASGLVSAALPLSDGGTAQGAVTFQCHFRRAKQASRQVKYPCLSVGAARKPHQLCAPNGSVMVREEVNEDEKREPVLAATASRSCPGIIARGVS